MRLACGQCPLGIYTGLITTGEQARNVTQIEGLNTDEQARNVTQIEGLNIGEQARNVTQIQVYLPICLSFRLRPCRDFMCSLHGMRILLLVVK